MITVLYEKESQILQFAASELKKYLEKLWVQVSILPYVEKSLYQRYL